MISTQIQRLQGAKSDIKDAIEAKGVSVPSSATLDEYDGYIAQIETGGGSTSVEESDVNFYDYDGTIVASYTKAEFLALDAMPSNPSHSGLTAQGWNWTYAAAKTYVQNYGVLDVGQMYVTASGKTEIDVELQEGTLSPYLGFGVNGSVDIDWGDGSTPDAVTGTNAATRQNTQHTYSAAGSYTIKLTVNSGTLNLFGASRNYNTLLWTSATTNYISDAYGAAVKAVRIGTSTTIGNYAFARLGQLRYVTIPTSVTTLSSYTFSDAGIVQIIIPTSVTSLSLGTAQYVYCLKRIILPSSITTMASGALTLNSYNLKRLLIPPSVVTMGMSFGGSYYMDRVVVPEGVTTLGGSFCQNVYALPSITIPSTVTSIGNNSFQNCYGCRKYVLLPTTPPTLGSNTFTNIHADCKIYVPAGTLETYQNATDWSNCVSYMVEMES